MGLVILNTKGRPGEKPPEGVFCDEDFCLLVFGRPGGDLLSQVLRHSTIGAEAFDGRVRDGIGSGHFARATRPAKDKQLLIIRFFQRDRSL